MASALKAEEAERRLVAMLQQRWGATDKLDLHRFWPVFKEFTRISFDVPPEDDLLLFECSVEEAAEGGQFYAGFIRQFSVQSGGGYGHMEQTGCNFYYPASAHLSGFSESLWSDEAESGGGPETFLSLLESLPVFQSLAVLTPERAEFWNTRI